MCLLVKVTIYISGLNKILYADENYVMYYECLNSNVDAFGNCERHSEYVEVLSRRRGGNAHAKLTTKLFVTDCSFRLRAMRNSVVVLPISVSAMMTLLIRKNPQLLTASSLMWLGNVTGSGGALSDGKLLACLIDGVTSL